MNKRTLVGITALFGMSIAGLVWIGVTASQYPKGAAGGGGGSAFSIGATPKACGPICEGILGYLIAKAGDYVVTQMGQPTNCANGCGAPGPGGGGGGSAFPSPQDATSDPVVTAKTN